MPLWHMFYLLRPSACESSRRRPSSPYHRFHLAVCYRPSVPAGRSVSGRRGSFSHSNRRASGGGDELLQQRSNNGRHFNASFQSLQPHLHPANGMDSVCVRARVSPAATLNVNHTFYKQKGLSYFLTLLPSLPDKTASSHK